jgi:hypothetical protein
MEPPVAAALIAAGASLAVAVWNSIQNANARKLQTTEGEESRKLQKDLAAAQAMSERKLAQFKAESERELEKLKIHLNEAASAQGQLRRYRDPVLDAANDLGHRIDNIRHLGFLAYLGHEYGRRDIALASTLYRLARYFGTLEALYAGVNYLRFERDEETRAVAEALAAVGRAFASDGYDRADDAFASSKFMIWREEQRAMGESVRQRDDTGDGVCVGFAEFTRRLNGEDRQWFARFAADLEEADAEGSERLATLQWRLAELVELLDEDHRFVRADGSYSVDWLERAVAESRTHTA